jgi:hypothetical protein
MTGLAEYQFHGWFSMQVLQSIGLTARSTCQAIQSSDELSSQALQHISADTQFFMQASSVSVQVASSACQAVQRTYWCRQPSQQVLQSVLGAQGRHLPMVGGLFGVNASSTSRLIRLVFPTPDAPTKMTWWWVTCSCWRCWQSKGLEPGQADPGWQIQPMTYVCSSLVI